MAPAAAPDSTPAILAAVDACLGYVETGTFNAAPLTRAGFQAGRNVSGPDYTARIGTSTMDRLNMRQVTVAPRRTPGCQIVLSSVGGTLASATNTINQRIISDGWAYAPEGRKRSYTKGALRMDMTGGAYQAIKTYALTLR